MSDLISTAACLRAIGRRALVDGRVHAFAGQRDAVQTAHNAKELWKGRILQRKKTRGEKSAER